MKTITTFILCGILSAFSFAQMPGQVSNLVIYSEGGETFTVKLNGQLKNEVPQVNVKIQNLNMAKYRMNIDFSDATLPDMSKDVYLNPGYEVVYAIKKNNRGEYVLRPQSQTPLSGAMANNTAPVSPNNNVSYSQNPSNVNQNTTTYSQSTTVPNSSVTYSQTTTTTTLPNSSVNVNLSVPNVNVTVTDPTMQSTTTYTQTTTSTSNNNTTYTTNTPQGNGRCAYPMNSSDFEAAVNTINAKSFDDTKLTIAKQIINSNCLKTTQVKRIMSLFSFEATKLDLAKYSYMHTYDPQNYFQLNDAFTYSSSVDDLNTYINGLR